jgi:L-ribulokinase
VPITATCHVMNSEVLGEAPGMCGVVKDGITTGYWGYEAGQSAVGDIFAWYVDNGVPPRYHERAAARGISVHELLSLEGAQQPIGGHGLIALDWMGGNRSNLVDHTLSGLVVGITLATRPPEIYRALLESTAFGTRAIIENLQASGVPVTDLVVAGGLLRNPILMQIYADVCGRAISVIKSDQGPALGSAIHAAVAADVHADVQVASEAMGRLRRDAYTPDPARVAAYDELYEEYVTLYDYFGRGANEVMHRLHDIRTRRGGAR